MSEKLTVSDLVQLFECPVCLDTKDPGYLTQCKNGHHGCTDCFSRLEVCPICRQALHKSVKVVSDVNVATLQTELRHLETHQGIISPIKLFEFLKCASCHFIPTQFPIMQCHSGHIKCFACSLYMSACIHCKPELTLSDFRCLLTERILSKITKPCKFTDNGCVKTMTELGSHEFDECYFQVVNCIFFCCYKKVSLEKYLQHLEEFDETHWTLTNHLEEDYSICRGFLQLPGKYGLETFPLIKARDWNPISYLKLNDNNHFFMELIAWKYDQICYFWVYYLSTPIEAKKFYFKLKLFNHDSQKTIDIQGPVCSINKKCFQVAFSSWPYKLPFSEILEFWDQPTLSFFWEVQVYEGQDLPV